MSRFRIGGLAGSGVLVLVALMPAPGPRPLELAAPPQTVQLGVMSSQEGTSLVRLDPVSLERSGRPLPLKGYGGAWTFSPDRRFLALAVRRWPEGNDDTLRFFTTAGPRPLRRGVSLGGAAAALAWVRSDRILAYVDRCCGDPGVSVLAIDPGARRVVARTPIDGSVLQLARGPDSFVLLVAEPNRIGPSRLVVVDAQGSSRSVKLDGTSAGTTWPDQPATEPIGTRLIPGLAVDPAGKRAFVIAPDGAAVEVDLGSLAVSFHGLTEPRSVLDRVARWLTPVAEAKGINGPALTARWLGNGLVAVAGSDESAVQENGELRVSARPRGLHIVDTGDWSVRLLDAGADAVTVADGLLLARGSSSSERQTQSGMGVAVYGPDRTRRFQLFPGRPAWIAFVYRGQAYVSVAGESALRVVDLASGRIVGTRSESPWPLLRDWSSF
ncbi:MAG TPA: hypothetical protein VF891_04850 [Gaiellaceae bacterium]